MIVTVPHKAFCTQTSTTTMSLRRQRKVQGRRPHTDHVGESAMPHERRANVELFAVPCLFQGVDKMSRFDPRHGDVGRDVC